MLVSSKSVAALSVAATLLSSTAAFAPKSSVSSSAASTSTNTKVGAATLADAFGGIANPFAPKQQMPSPPENDDNNEDPRKGAMAIDIDGIAFSGLNGKALSLNPEDFPLAKDIRAVIPEDCFELETDKSLGYLSVSVVGTALCTAIGVNMLDVFNPDSLLTLPVWTAYSAVTGTVAMGLWVLAHECGHGAFSKNKQLQDAVGYIIHSIMLVPYYSWQRSHAVHHQYTNHMELGETHVPESVAADDDGSLAGRTALINALGKEDGLKAWGAIQGFLHLIVGWPAYLLIGATGGPARGMTNHYYANPLTTPDQPKKELFPGNWKEKVYKSDIGIAAVLGIVAAWTACNGVGQMMALYGGPLIVVNAWLVAYTWLQHTDVDVPHFGEDDHNFVRGALHTIDRPYDKLDPWGAIDFLHHKIGTTHVAHHFDSTIPHYKAQAATDAIKEKFPELYLYDPTPIPEALWRVCKGCTAVEKRGDRWVWKNDGLEEQLEI